MDVDPLDPDSDLNPDPHVPKNAGSGSAWKPMRIHNIS